MRQSVQITLFQWGHNLSVMDTGDANRQLLYEGVTGFNGATTSRSWILVTVERNQIVQIVFQWGHNLSVMDTVLFIYTYP